MASKVILVTGGNKGIGLAIVETLLKQLPEALVLLGSRDAGRNLSISMLVLRYFPRIVFSRLLLNHFSTPQAEVRMLLLV